MTRPPHLPVGAQRLVGDTYCIPSLTNSGYVDGLLVDTGPDESVYDGLAVEQIVITHGHADHFACAARLRDGGATVIASREDARMVENPEVNIRGMFSWAKPGDLLVSKLFQGEGCPVDGFVDTWADDRALAVPLPGHTLGHTGLLTDDGVLFTGDALYLEELWERHRLPYAIDPDLVAASLSTIASLDFEWLVPGHGTPVARADAARHIAFHVAQIREIEDLIFGLLAEERTTEEIISLVNAARGISENPAQYWLAVTTVKGFLGCLHGREQIEFFVRGHVGYWRALAGGAAG